MERRLLRLLATLGNKQEPKIEIKPKNYKGMENRMTPCGSLFEDMTASLGVSIREGVKNKAGKPSKPSMNQNLTRTEYIMNSSKSFATLPAIKNTDFALPNIKEAKMDETIEMNSTIMSNINLKMSESHNILPPLDNSNLGFSMTKQQSFYLKSKYSDKISSKDKTNEFIENSLIIKSSKADRLLAKSKSSGLLSLLPDK